MSRTERFGDYDFGLNEEQEQRAARLHAESLVIDMLFQGPVGHRSYDEEMIAAIPHDGTPSEGYVASVAAPIRAAIGGTSKEFQRVWEASGITGGNRQCSFSDEARVSWGLAQAQFDHFDWLVKALRADDFRRAKSEGKRAGYMSTQDTDGMDRKLARLRSAYDAGMRMIGLTYNVQSAVGGGCTDRTDAGLTNFGVEIVRLMNELGIIVDTSHSSRQTTLDACAVSDAPVVISHASAGALYEIDRSKSDEEIQAIAATGGVIGIVAVPFFLAPSEGVTIEAMLDHIDHVSQLAGWQHVGIGTDWPLQADRATLERVLLPMCYEIGFREEHNIDPHATLRGFDDYRDFPNITRGLVARGYDDEQIRGILGGNFLRVFETVCG